MPVVRPDVRGRFFHEEVPPIDAHIASIEIARGNKRGARHWGIRATKAAATAISIMGLASRPGTAHAGHMLDVHYKVPDVLVKDAPFLLEKVMPVRMIIY